MGFTILELLVACAVLALLTVLLAAMVNSTFQAWKTMRGRAEQFQQARTAFDAVTRRLSEATLNTYYDYVDADGKVRTPATTDTFTPARYVRQSELRFFSGSGITGNPDASTQAVFFQAPEGRRTSGSGLEKLLNTVGFFVELGSDAAFLPSMLDSSFAKKRFRLFQMIEPSAHLSVYNRIADDPDYDGKEWFQDALTNDSGVSIVAENVIALVLLPMLSAQDQGSEFDNASLAPTYVYDSTVAKGNPSLNSKNQLPPIIKVTLVAIDEASANRMTLGAQTSLQTLLSGLFQSVGSTTDTSVPGYAKDLKTLEDHLTDQKITYRIFSSNVSLKAAKWSTEQKN